jgi:hypothetical protein
MTMLAETTAADADTRWVYAFDRLRMRAISGVAQYKSSS